MIAFKHKHGWLNLDEVARVTSGREYDGQPCLFVHYASSSTEIAITDPDDMQRLTALLDLFSMDASSRVAWGEKPS